METIRLVLADDHPLVRAGIRTTLVAEPDLMLVGEAADGYEARRLCQELGPDVLLLDLSMPGPPPVETVVYLCEHCPVIKVLVLTAYDDDAYVHSLVIAGVTGYVLKDEVTETVVRAIRTVVRGDTWFSRSVVEKLARWKASEPDEVAEPDLTTREQQILGLIARGWDNAHIAAQMNLAEQTVRNYISRLYAKLGVNSRCGAVVWVNQHGIAYPKPEFRTLKTNTRE